MIAIWTVVALFVAYSVVKTQTKTYMYFNYASRHKTNIKTYIWTNNTQHLHLELNQIIVTQIRGEHTLANVKTYI